MKMNPKKIAEKLEQEFKHEYPGDAQEITRRLAAIDGFIHFLDRDADSNTVLHHLAKSGSAAAITSLMRSQQFLDAPASRAGPSFVNAKNNDGCTALDVAAHHNQWGAVVALVQSAKADYHGFDAEGRTVADRAFSEGCREATDYLQKHASKRQRQALEEAPADANLRDGSGWTQLHHAVNARDWKQIGQLITQGADWHAKDFKGESPIWILAREGDTEGFNTLALRGIVMDATNREGETLMHAAVASGSPAMVDAVHDWAEKRSPGMGGALSRSGDQQGDTPLYVVAKKAQGDARGAKWVDMAHRLGKFGANPWYGRDGTSSLVRLPLAEALLRGQPEVAHALLDLMDSNRPADMDTGEQGFDNGELVSNDDWGTCLHYAVMLPSADLVKRLLPHRPWRSNPKSITVMIIEAERLKDRCATSDATKVTEAESARVLAELRAAPSDDAFVETARATKAAVRAAVREERQRRLDRHKANVVSGPEPGDM